MELSYKEQERYFISIILAIAIHIIVLLAITIFLNIKVKAFPEYPEPLSIEISGDSLPELKTDNQIAAEKRETSADKKADDKKGDEGAAIAFNSNVKEKEKIIDQSKKETPVKKGDAKSSYPEDKQSIEKRKETTDNDRDDSKLADSKEKKETAEPTFAPSPTGEPYIPALEQDNLAQLDKLLDQGDSKTGKDTSSKKTSDKTDTSKDKDTSPVTGKEPVFVWEDNKDRKPLITAKPEIPSWVSQQGLRLVVVVSFLLTPDGILTLFKIEQSSGYTDVDTRVTDALRKWKFQAVPGTKNIRGQITYIIDVK
jgi:TonB family protein